MKIDFTKAVMIAVIAAALVVGAYVLGRRQADTGAPVAHSDPVATTPATATQPEASPTTAADTAQVRPLRPGEQRPAAHLPLSPGGAATGTVKTEGREGIRFAHYRIGNRNVKSMLADEGLVWVGTSGGVIRYDIAAEDYQLFDVRSGLLSNGIFHLSKLGDRLAVGTYGGGLSLLDKTDNSWQHYNIQHGLGDAFVYDMLEMDNGDVWIATWSGANRIRGGKLDDLDAWDIFTVENTQATSAGNRKKPSGTTYSTAVIERTHGSNSST